MRLRRIAGWPSWRPDFGERRGRWLAPRHLGCQPRAPVTAPFDVVVLVKDPDHAVARVGNLVVVVWVGETRAHDVRHVGELLRGLARPVGKLGLLQVILHQAKPPEQDTREALIEVLRAGRDRLAASAVVYPGDGFIMAAARAFVSGIAMLARPGFPHVVFSGRDEACEWIARLLPRVDGYAWTAREVREIVDDFVAKAAG